MLKKLSLLVASIFLTILVYSQPGMHSIFNSTDSTTVSGKIDGYSPKQEEQFVNYFTYDITGKQTKFAAPIQKDGKFNFKFLQQYEGDFGMQCGANFIIGYAIPGEHIDIDIDNNVADKVYHFPGAFKIKGSSSAITGHILKFFAIYLPMMYERGLDMKLPIEEFVELMHLNLEKDLTVLDKYNQKNDPPEVFRNWARNWLTYEAASYILIKPFVDRTSKPKSDSLMLRILRSIKINNIEALNNVAYYKFLTKLAQNLQMTIQNGIIYTPTPIPNSIPDSILKRLTDSIRKKYPNTISNESPIPITNTLDKIDQHMSGLVREIGYYSIYTFNAYSQATGYKLDQIWERFDQVIKDNFIQQSLEQKRTSSLKTFTSFNIIEKIEKLDLDFSLKKNLLAVLRKEKGKYVYIDFWGSWCKPCMAEMPYYKALMEEMKDESISFLFLSVETSSKDMKNTKEKYGITGTFVSLNKNDTDIANETFGFSSYPSHFLIDPNGNLVTGNIMISISHPQSAAAQLKRYMK